jgi:peroxiredoxin Q/BCP
MSGEHLIGVGEQAPDFELPGSDGKTYQLRSVLEQQHVALVFYPGNNTPG